MNWSDRIFLQQLLDKPRAFRYSLIVAGAPMQKKMILLSSDYPTQYLPNKNNCFTENRKKY